jgi:hypothetical protein
MMASFSHKDKVTQKNGTRKAKFSRTLGEILSDFYVCYVFNCKTCLKNILGILVDENNFVCGH